jgi:hypothetical protein
MRLRTRRIAVMAALVIGIAGPVLADEMRQVQNGSVVTTNLDSGVFFLSGSDFFVAGLAKEGVGTALVQGMSPGETGTLSSTWAGEMSFSNVIASVDSFAGPVFLAGLIDLDAGSFIVPSMPAGSVFTLQRPFSLSSDSQLMGFFDSQLHNPAFHFGIAGSGLATLTLPFTATGPGMARIDYRFSGQAAPVPEPSLVLLLGMATGGMLLVARRKTNHVV